MPTGGVGIRIWWLDLDNGIPFDDVPICTDCVIAIFLGLASRRIVSFKCCRFVFSNRRWDLPFDGLIISSRARKTK